MCGPKLCACWRIPRSSDRMNRELRTERQVKVRKERQKDRVTQDLEQAAETYGQVAHRYQEDLLLLNEVRRRMPAMRQREQRLRRTLRRSSESWGEQADYLRWRKTITRYWARCHPHSSAHPPPPPPLMFRTVSESQAARKEVVVADDSITFHIRFPATRPAGGNGGHHRNAWNSERRSRRPKLTCACSDGSLQCGATAFAA